ncbi:MAG: hypothetical protein ACRCWR_04185 [Saezia sp.]
MKKIVLSLFLGLVLSGASFAKSYICTTDDNFVRYIKDNTLFYCTGGLPKMTFKEIIAKGYRVISIAASNAEDANYLYTEWAIVIEK